MASITLLTNTLSGASSMSIINTNFTNINNALPVGTPATAALDNLAAVAINASLVLATSDAFALGSTTKQWSDLFLAEGGVINWDNGDATITQTSDDITLAGITTFGVGTSTAVTLGTIELGAASDTTLSRSSAGVLAVEGVVIPSISSTNTLTNKRITKRAPAVTQSATPAINTDITDVAHITGLAQAITSMTSSLSGTPVEGDTLRIDITDNGTARAITWGASFEASGTVSLPTTTVLSVRLDVGFFWNTATSKWRCVAVS